MGNTPAELGFKPWTIDLTADMDGRIDIPTKVHTERDNEVYRLKDWDPPLRANEAAIEFSREVAENTGTQANPVYPNWDAIETWLTANDLGWLNSNANHTAFIQDEIEELQALMTDDRDRYMAELVSQADGAPLYLLSLLGVSPSSKPWTWTLINFGLQIGYQVSMHFKRKYHRVRPSLYCPGLLPSFGPPRHPSFPSGHATQSFITNFLLMQIPEVNVRYGEELYWLARRVAVGRERAGLHYRSDSTCGMHLALGTLTGLMGWKKVADLPIQPDSTLGDRFLDFTFQNVSAFECPAFYSPSASSSNIDTKEKTYGLLNWAREEWTNDLQ